MKKRITNLVAIMIVAVISVIGFTACNAKPVEKTAQPHKTTESIEPVKITYPNEAKVNSLFGQTEFYKENFDKYRRRIKPITQDYKEYAKDNKIEIGKNEVVMDFGKDFMFEKYNFYVDNSEPIKQTLEKHTRYADTIKEKKYLGYDYNNLSDFIMYLTVEDENGKVVFNKRLQKTEGNYFNSMGSLKNKARNFEKPFKANKLTVKYEVKELDFVKGKEPTISIDLLKKYIEESATVEFKCKGYEI